MTNPSAKLGKKLMLMALTLAILSACAGPGTTASPVALATGQVVALTATTTVEASGTVEALQTASLAWKTTGQVAEVRVKPGDLVKQGAVLMALDPASAPQNIIQAQADLLTAQNNLEELVKPSALTIANAQKAIADAQKTLDEKQRALRNLAAPDVAYYADQLKRAQQSLTAAEQNAEVTGFATNLRNAEDNLTNATNQLNKYKELEAQYPGYGQQHGDILTRSQEAYDRAVQDYQSALYNFQQAQNNSANSVADAKEKLATAEGNFRAAQANPDAIKLAQAQADVAVAEATLADKQQKLADLQNGGNADEVAAARAKVLATQASLDALYLKAPFDGEILTVNARVGDLATQTGTVLVLANRSVLHVDVAVDESDVTRIQTGDDVNISFNSIADLIAVGKVSEINPVGQTTQGLVKYTVTVDMPTADVRVLLGMTADVAIVTDVEKDALAVPIDAVQSDDQGEYVLRIKDASGEAERVAVQSGITQGDLVVVKGSLAVGDTLQIPAVEQQLPRGPFGG